MHSSRHEADVVVIGAGAAGLAAARRLSSEPLTLLVLEAGVRPGGRAWTQPGPLPLDLGCGWLHSGDKNPWTRITESLGLAVDRCWPPWRTQSRDIGFSAADQESYRSAFGMFESRFEEAAQDPQDRPASELLEPGGRWNALMNAVGTYVSGAEYDEISVHDHARYADSGVNWRIPAGYGTAVARYGADVPVRCGVQATEIDHSGPVLRITTNAGMIVAKAAVITVSTGVLARGGLRFTPDLPEKRDAAEGLPLGLANKVFLSLSEPADLPVDGHLYGATDRVEIGSYHLRPFGRPVIEGYFGGGYARDLEQGGERAIEAAAVDELAALLGSDVRKRLAFITASCWGKEPHIRGSYSYARVGRAESRAVLSAPVDERLFFAGEACSLDSFSTAHGAYETGIAAAEAVLNAKPLRNLIETRRVRPS